MSQFHNCQHCGSNKTRCIGPGDYHMNPKVRGETKRALNYECVECNKITTELPKF